MRPAFVFALHTFFLNSFLYVMGVKRRLNFSASASKRRRTGRRRPAARRSRLTVRTTRSSTEPLPPRFICKMKYSNFLTLNAHADGESTCGVEKWWKINSTFNPFSGDAHQPHGRDTLVTMYNRYRVMSCGYSIVVRPNDNSNCSLYVETSSNANTLTGALVTEARERSRCFSRVIARQVPTRIAGKISCSKLAGCTRQEYKADRFHALANADPDDLLYLRTALSAAMGTAVFIDVCLTFTVEWFDPIELGQS